MSVIAIVWKLEVKEIQFWWNFEILFDLLKMTLFSDENLSNNHDAILKLSKISVSQAEIQLKDAVRSEFNAKMNLKTKIFEISRRKSTKFYQKNSK